MNARYLTVAASLLLASSLESLASNTVVITATRTPQSIDDTLAPVTVITREDIERLQAQSVQDLLRGQVGIHMDNSGGAGKQTAIRIRGAESDHILVLIDGARVGSVTLGTTAFQHLPIEQIERIEIVRGPRSGLYGSDAMAGIFHIFTRKAATTKLSPYASIHSESDKTYRHALGISGRSTRAWFNINANHAETEGFNACNGKPFPNGAGCFTEEPDNDGYRNTSISARAGSQISKDMTLDVNMLRTEGDTEFDSSFVNESTTLQQLITSTLNFKKNGGWHTKFTTARNKDDSKNFKDGTFKTRFVSVRDSLSLQNDFSITGNQIYTFGVDHLNERIESTTAYEITSRENTGVFAQSQISYHNHDFLFSLRHDDNEQFGGHLSSSTTWGYHFTPSLKYILSYSSAFKAPSFNELYFPGFGNSELSPEKVHNIEVGIQGNRKNFNWSTNIFNARYDRLITYDATLGRPVNINKARVNGIETTFNTSVENWNIQTNLTLLDPKSQSNNQQKGNTLPRRAKQTLRLDVERQLHRYSIGLTLLAEGHRYDDLDNTRRMGGYTTFDFRVVYRFNKSLSLYGRIENIFNKQYETAALFNQSGRQFSATLRYQPK